MTAAPIRVDRVKHLEMIQGVVTRMAGNSFLLRGWSVTLVAGLLAMSRSETQLLFGLLASLVAIAFWGLDAYYLRKERLFRALYVKIRVAADDVLAQDPYTMSTEGLDEWSWGCTLLRPVVVGLHGPILAVIFMIVRLWW